jgi:hypothetical protein
MFEERRKKRELKNSVLIPKLVKPVSSEQKYRQKLKIMYAVNASIKDRSGQ